MGGPSSTSLNRTRSAYRAVVDAWKVFVAVWEVELPPITQPNRVFWKRSLDSSGCVRLICPTHIDASVEPELNKISIGAGKWNRGSTNIRFQGVSRIERSMGWLGIRVDMVDMARNVNVRLYVLSVEVIVAVTYRFEIFVKVSKARIGTEYLFCLISSEFTNCSDIPVSSCARHRIGCCFLFSTLI